MLRETGKLDCLLATTPVDPHMKLDKADSSSPVDKISFQRLIGRLIYLNHYMPDISYVVNILRQFKSNPRVVHQVAADRLLAYLKNTVGQGVFFKRGEDIQLSVYTDADFGESPVDWHYDMILCFFGP